MDQLLVPVFSRLLKPLAQGMMCGQDQQQQQTCFTLPALIIAGKNATGKSTFASHLMNQFHIRPEVLQEIDPSLIVDMDDTDYNDDESDDYEEDTTEKSFFPISPNMCSSNVMVWYTAQATDRKSHQFLFQCYQRMEDSNECVLVREWQSDRIGTNLSNLVHSETDVTFVKVSCPPAFNLLIDLGCNLVDLPGVESTACTQSIFDWFINDDGPLPKDQTRVVAYVMAHDSISEKDKDFINSLKPHEPLLVVNKADGLKKTEKIQEEVRVKLSQFFEREHVEFYNKLMQRIYFHSCVNDALGDGIYNDMAHLMIQTSLTSLRTTIENKKKNALQDIEIINGQLTHAKMEHQYQVFIESFDGYASEQSSYIKAMLKDEAFQRQIKEQVFQMLSQKDDEAFSATISGKKLLDSKNLIQETTVGKLYLKEVYFIVDRTVCDQLVKHLFSLTSEFVLQTKRLLGNFLDSKELPSKLEGDLHHSFSWRMAYEIRYFGAAFFHFSVWLLNRKITRQTRNELIENHLNHLEWNEVVTVILGLVDKYKKMVLDFVAKERDSFKEKLHRPRLEKTSDTSSIGTIVEERMKDLSFCCHANYLVNNMHCVNLQSGACHVLSVLSLLGAGGFGSVYLAHDGQKHVALKVVDFTKNGRLALHEFHNLVTLKHKNIVSLHGVLWFKGEAISQNGLVWENLCMDSSSLQSVVFIMQYGGQNLQEYLNGKTTTVHKQKRLDILIQIAEAVQYCHGKNVLHRDLKLNNILIDDAGEVRLCDFGFSKSLAFVSGSVLGTHPFPPEMMSNETQVYGKSVDMFKFGEIILKIWGENDSQSEIAKLGHRCCLPQETERPDIGFVVGKMKEIYNKVYV